MKHVRPEFDRACDEMVMHATRPQDTHTGDQRGALDLEKDASQHRRFHVLYQDLMN
ncbi:hypothetical protein SAMN05421665_3039 [Yoonia rosea]|uniref:Uncharacterized protein n=1 Tax=Yoonia rosea TaxID=287098 RepID=A0A1R3XGV2_9RHOB|nr:hypothetical protein [Yoonia rosea]SIT90247.1 hypothetical protein SAMN05421665_3039 [Yoonia rosea]